jgi:hypothetical protein
MYGSGVYDTDLHEEDHKAGNGFFSSAASWRMEAPTINR